MVSRPRLPGPGRRAWPLGALAVVAALALAWTWLAGGGLTGRSDRAWARIRREGVLRVGMDASYPPFEVVDSDGNYLGYDVDLARALGERWGVDVQFVNVHYDGLYDALRVGKFDLIISALPYDRTLTRDVRYSRSYFQAGQVLVVRGDAGGIDGVADLDGRRVAVELGAESHQLARRLVRDRGLGLEILPVREPEELLEHLVAGDAEAAICDRVHAHALLRADGTLRIVGEPLTDEPYVIAADIAATDLMRHVDEALAEWERSGYLQSLAARWF